MANGRQYLIEITNLQPEALQVAGFGTISFVASSVTGAVPQTAASFSIIDGNNQTSVVSTAVTALPSIRVVDTGGLPVSGTSVSFIQLSSLSGVVTGAQQTTNANGIATAGSWSLGTQVGTQRMEVKAGSLSTQTFSATAIAGSAFSISPSGGTSQTTHVGGILPSRLTVLVEDNWRNPVSNQSVTFTSTDDDSAFFESVITTGAAGTSGTTYGVGIDILNSVASIFAAISSTTSAVFAATSTVSLAASISIVQGDGQVGEISTALPTNPMVEIDDFYGNPITSSQVTWVAGAGSLSTARTPTNSNGTAGTVWTLGGSAGTQLLTARGDFLSGSTVTFTVSTTSPASALMALFGGNNQSGLVGANLPSRLTVRFTTVSGSSAAGANATWISSDGTLGAAQVVSDTDGYAGVTFSLGTTARTSIITATTSGVTGSPVTFAVSATTNQASSLTFAVQPSSNVGDATIFTQQPQVQIIDLYGNSCLSNAVSVSIQTNSATGTVALSGTTNITTNATGRATWTNLKATGAGQGFTLNTTSSGLTAKQSNTVNIAPPVGSKLAFTVQPANITAGQVFSPTVLVAVQDSTGNNVVGATDPIQLTISGAGVLTGTTLRDASSGLATFSSLGVTTPAGTYTITATSGTLTQAVSASFTVSAAGPHDEESGSTEQISYRIVTDTFGTGWTGIGGTGNMAASVDSVLGGTSVRVDYNGAPIGSGVIKGQSPYFANLGSYSCYEVEFVVESGFVFPGAGTKVFYTRLNTTVSAAASGHWNLYGNKVQWACESGPHNFAGNGSGGLRTLTSTTLFPGGLSIAKDTRHLFSIYQHLNTVDGSGFAVADGVVRIKLDGVTVINQTDVAMRGKEPGGTSDTPGTAQFRAYKFDLIPSGSGTVSGFIRLGNIYASTKT